MRAKIVLSLILWSCLYTLPSLAAFKVIGYLPTWNGYPNSVNNVDFTVVNHLNIAFANPNAAGNLVTSSGSLADLAAVVTKAHTEGALVLMSIGGASAPGARYTTLINADVNAFVTKIVQYAVNNNLDGIDVDLEGDVVNGTTMTKEQYETFVTALQTALHAESKIMTAALATWFANNITNTAAGKFDFINIMSYDAYGTWTGPGQHSPYSLAQSDLDYWKTVKGITASKLTVGVPFYGYYWGTTNSAQTFSAIVSSYPGFENYDRITPGSGGILYYNGIPTIKQKMAMAMAQAGGIMIWELTQDASGTNSLLAAIKEVSLGDATNVAPAVSITSPAASTTFTEGDTISITINAADSDGSLLRTEYYAGTFKIGDQYGTPTTMKWSNAGPGTYSLTVKVIDNLGKTTTSAPVSITVTATTTSMPFTGTPFDIPGKIEAENFNLGGNNKSYSDGSSTNQGGAYRTGRVDIEECYDTGGGYDVGWTAAGEWLEYTVNIATSGTYTFQTRVATENSGESFHIEMDGSNVTGTIAVPNTTGWQKWQTITTNGIVLYAGTKKMRLYFNTGDFNINYVNVVFASTSPVMNGTSSETTNMVFPNPVVQNASVHFYLKESNDTKVTLLDAKGNEVLLLTEQFMEAGEHELALTRGALPKGLYFCKISGTKDVITIKVVME